MYAKQSIAAVPVVASILVILILAIVALWPMTTYAAEQSEDTENWRFMELNAWDYQATFASEPADGGVLSTTERQFLEDNIWEITGRLAHPAGSPDKPARISVWLYDTA